MFVCFLWTFSPSLFLSASLSPHIAYNKWQHELANNNKGNDNNNNNNINNINNIWSSNNSNNNSEINDNSNSCQIAGQFASFIAAASKVSSSSSVSILSSSVSLLASSHHYLLAYWHHHLPLIDNQLPLLTWSSPANILVSSLLSSSLLSASWSPNAFYGFSTRFWPFPSYSSYCASPFFYYDPPSICYDQPSSTIIFIDFFRSFIIICRHFFFTVCSLI